MILIWCWFFWAIERAKSGFFAPIFSGQLSLWVCLAAYTGRSQHSKLTSPLHNHCHLLLEYFNTLEIMKLTCYPGAKKRAVDECTVAFSCSRNVRLYIQFYFAEDPFYENVSISLMTYWRDLEVTNGLDLQSQEIFKFKVLRSSFLPNIPCHLLKYHIMFT